MAAVVTVFLVCLPGCALPKNEMRKAFDESLQATIGRTLNELKNHPSRAFVGKREPTEVRRLVSGNLLHVYHDYWGQYGIKREMCTVFLEFSADTAGDLRVVRSTSEGDGCYRAY